MIYATIGNKKLLWIHCPKTSGFSQADRLFENERCVVTPEDRSTHDEIIAKMRQMDGGIRHPDHETLHMNIKAGGPNVSGYIPLVTMRDPLDWHQSWYHFYKVKNFGENQTDLQGKSFIEYVQWLDGVKSGVVKPIRQGGRYHCLMNQSDWSWDGARHRIENTLDMAQIDNQFPSYMNDNFGLDDIEMVHKNKTGYPTTESSHTDETIDIIKHHYAIDFEIYDQVKNMNRGPLSE